MKNAHFKSSAGRELSRGDRRILSRLAISPAAAGLGVAIAAALWFYGRQPLFHTDLWGHLAYGRLICQERALPATEPFMPLAQGVPLVDSAWLSQVVFYGAYSAGGAAALQLLHAATIAGCLVILATIVFRQTRGFATTALALAAFEAIDWYQVAIARPQNLGLFCFIALIALSTRRRRKTSGWLAIATLFALWANLHGSFIVGIGWLGCRAVGRMFDVGWRTRSWSAPFRDRAVRRAALWTGVAAAAVLANPYGARLYAEVLTFPRNPNLRDLIEWQRLDFDTRQGRIFAAAAVLLTVCGCLVRPRPSSRALLPLAVFGAAAVSSARMIVWWGPMAAMALSAMADRLVRQFFPAIRTAGDRGGGATWRKARTPAWTLITLAAAIAALLSTPMAQQEIFGGTAPLERLVSSDTPVAAVEYLRAHPPPGQVFQILEWGDWLLWAGPPGVRVFLTSQVHLAPRDVWRDYLKVINVGSGWDDVLERYGVETILLDKTRRGPLIAHLAADPRFERIHEDDVAVVFARRAIARSRTRQTTEVRPQD